MNYQQFQFLLILWKMGVVDTFGVMKICANCGAQYMGVVLSSAAGNFSDIGPRALIEPITGLATGVQYVAAATTIFEKRKRIATLAAFLSASAAALTTDPTTNAAIGGAVASKIGYMKAMLARGGGIAVYEAPPLLGQQQITNVLLKQYFYRQNFTIKSKQIIDNIFYEHTMRRCGQLTNFNYVEACRTLPPMYFINNLPRTSLNLTGIVTWSIFAVTFLLSAGLGALYVFQYSKRQRWVRENQQSNEIIIDVPYVNVTNKSTPLVEFIPVK